MPVVWTSSSVYNMPQEVIINPSSSMGNAFRMGPPHGFYRPGTQHGTLNFTSGRWANKSANGVHKKRRELPLGKTTVSSSNCANSPGPVAKQNSYRRAKFQLSRVRRDPRAEGAGAGHTFKRENPRVSAEKIFSQPSIDQFCKHAHPYIMIWFPLLQLRIICDHADHIWYMM